MHLGIRCGNKGEPKPKPQELEEFKELEYPFGYAIFTWTWVCGLFLLIGHLDKSLAVILGVVSSLMGYSYRWTLDKNRRNGWDTKLEGLFTRELLLITGGLTVQLLLTELSVPLAQRPPGFMNRDEDTITLVLFFSPVIMVAVMVFCLPALAIYRAIHMKHLSAE